MKILHTGDLHLGKFFYDFSLIEDQKHILNSLINELISCKEEPYDALIIAGDVYDRSVPHVEAVQLFSLFLAKIKSKLPDLHVFIISGNHDSSIRLSYASELLEAENIHIRCDLNEITKPVIIDDVAFYSVPFASSNEIQNAISSIIQVKNQTQKSILISHLFTIGSLPSDSERTIWGQAEQVNVHLFDSFTYTALGHLHRFQNAGKNVYYSGSPLSYSFDECKNEKCFVKVQFDSKNGHQLKIEQIKTEPIRPVASLSGSFDDFYKTDKFDSYKNYFLEIQTTDDFIIENPVALLRIKFPYLLSFRQEKAIADLSSDNLSQRRKAIQNAKENLSSHFEIFLDELYPEEKAYAKDESKLFKTLYNELSNPQKELI